jgi:hypothetical protein
MFSAATQVGKDGRGKDGLTGYFHTLARADPKSFVSLMGRVLAYQCQFGPMEADSPAAYKNGFELFSQQIQAIADRRQEDEDNAQNGSADEGRKVR